MSEALSGSLTVFTFRAGLLARVGHDLRIRFSGFEFVRDHETITGHVNLRSFEVEGAIENGTLAGHALTATDKAKIRNAALNEVLRIERYPQAHIEASVIRDRSEVFVEGYLGLCGTRRALERTKVVLSDGWLHAGFVLTPSTFGIRPYRALAGALRLEDRVRVALRLQAPHPEAQTVRWRGPSLVGEV
jgi:hypothetical protein